MYRLFFAAFFCTSFSYVHAEVPEPAKPSKEHKFLKQFVGDWECVTEASTDPSQPADKSTGTMKGSMIGDFWAVVEVRSNSDHGEFVGRATFGFDSVHSKKYVGTWTDSMVPYLWKYEGKVDGNKLIFEVDGPDFSEPGELSKYRDTWEFKSKDVLILTSEVETPDGKMFQFMKSTCRRKKAE